MHASMIDDVEKKELQLAVSLLEFLSFPRMADMEISLVNSQALQKQLTIQSLVKLVQSEKPEID